MTERPRSEFFAVRHEFPAGGAGAALVCLRANRGHAACRPSSATNASAASLSATSPICRKAAIRSPRPCNRWNVPSASSRPSGASGNERRKNWIELYRRLEDAIRASAPDRPDHSAKPPRLDAMNPGHFGLPRRLEPKKTLRAVNFICNAPQAKAVSLVGDFNQLEPVSASDEADAGRRVVSDPGTEPWTSPLRVPGGWGANAGPACAGHHPQRQRRTRFPGPGQLDGALRHHCHPVEPALDPG